MRSLCFSSLAWDPAEDLEISKLLASYAVDKIELAPSKIWPELNLAQEKDVRAYKSFWQAGGFSIIALQSVLFGKPDFQILSLDKSIVDATFEYLTSAVRVASWLGAKVIVFGSPKNRLKKNLSEEDASDLATNFFLKLGDYAHNMGVVIGIEANPSAYGGDFILETKEAFDLVQKVNSPGFKLHLDVGGMLISKQSPQDVFKKYLSKAAHLHLSAPYLVNLIEASDVNYANLLLENEASEYLGAQSVEMLPAKNESNLSAIKKVLELLCNSK